MSETQVRRRGFGEDGIYLDAARNRYMGAISLGYGPDGKRIRRKVSGKTKQEVRAKLQALHQELNSGVRSSSTCTVREAGDDWLREGLDGTSDRARTLYEGLLGPVLDAIGARPLRVLSAGDVRSALSQLVTRYSTRSLRITRNSLERAIRHAESNDLVGCNVAALVKVPQGRSGRPSKSFTLDQAKALLAASEGARLHACDANRVQPLAVDEDIGAFRAQHLAVGKVHLPGAAWLSAQRHRCAAGLLVLD